MVNTIAKLFSEPFGQGYPKTEAARKMEDTRLLKSIKEKISGEDFRPDKKSGKPLLDKVLSKTDVVEYILENGNDEVSLMIQS